MLIASALLTLFVFGLVFFVREKDLPVAPPLSPTFYLEERKSVIYDSLRDLNFEFRVGKLSDSDYQQSKTELQRELSMVLSEIDAIQQRTPVVSETKPAAKAAKTNRPRNVCPHCNARFPQPLKFCGECGKAMGETA